MEELHDTEELARTRVRFFAKTKLADAPRPGMGTPCLEWTAGRSRDGYGKFAPAHKSVRAHRVAWELAHGPIPACLHVLHRCDNPLCVDVEHLFLGTNEDNIRDRDAKGRHVAPRGEAHRARMREVAARGERHCCAKLNDASVRSIRQLRDEGWTQRRLATKFGVSPSHIWSILARKTWAHVV